MSTVISGNSERQSERVDDLKFERDEAGLARDKAVYWLFRL